MNKHQFVETPWDSVVFGLPTYEIPEMSETLLSLSHSVPGHYTIRVDPRASKELLYRYGFYYSDTLLTPIVDKEEFVGRPDARASIDKSVSCEDLVDICRDAFDFGRFHRDFYLSKAAADQRYVNWVMQMFDKGEAFGLLWDGALAGFFACDGHKIQLHAIAKCFRGQGLAKHLWTAACEELFDSGHDTLQSSVSAANLAIVNLYASLGFRYLHAVDIYHRLTSAERK